MSAHRGSPPDSPARAPAGEELTRRRRLLILAILCSALLIVSLDGTIVNVALPSIGRDFHARVSGLQWIIDGYTVVMASLLMLSGSTADRVGRRRVFSLGLCIFTLGSLLCSLAPDLTWLVVFRVLQATGGSMLTPVALSIVRNVFTDPAERAQAIGFWSGTVGISLTLGPILGGLLVQSLDWRAVFWINLPIGMTALFLTRRFVPESRAPRPRRLDPVGQLLVIATLGLLTFSIIEGPRHGWRSGEILATFALSAAGLVALLAWERRRREPLIELRFFRSVPFSGANAIAVSAFASLSGFLFLNTLYLQEVRGLSALKAGLCLLPLASMTMIFSPISGRLVAHGRARGSLALGGCAIMVAALLLTDLARDTPLAVLLLSYGVLGVGLGVVNSPISNTALTGMPPAQAGVAAAVASTARQVGQTLGVAIVGATATGGVLGIVPGRFVAATHTGYWIIVACGAVVAILGVLTTSERAQGTARRALADLEDGPPAVASVPAA